MLLLSLLVISPAEPFCKWSTDSIDPESESAIDFPVGSIWLRTHLEGEFYFHVLKVALKFGLPINCSIKQLLQHIDPCGTAFVSRRIIGRPFGVVVGVVSHSCEWITESLGATLVRGRRLLPPHQAGYR